MVSDRILIRDKWRGVKKFLVILGVFILISAVLIGVFLMGFFSGGENKIIIVNPINNLISENTNEAGQIDLAAVQSKGVLEFDENYINYILLSLGVDYLHNSLVYGNPIIELSLDNEVWSSELDKGNLKTEKKFDDNEDLRISLSKEEAVQALLSSDIKQSMKESVNSGNTKIERVAGKTELLSKGYLKMYKELNK